MSTVFYDLWIVIHSFTAASIVITCSGLPTFTKNAEVTVEEYNQI